MSNKPKLIKIRKGQTVTSTTETNWPFMKKSGWEKVTGEVKAEQAPGNAGSQSQQPPQK